jgi:formylglycine-generating enzyme required for sulfatase activity
MDMAGNIFEWVADKYDVTYYANSPYANPPGPERARMGAGWPPAAIDYYTLRGGSYHDNWWYSRVTHRHWGHHGDWPNGDSPLFRSFRAGIRCARPLAQP